MDANLKEKWVEALRSGRFAQTQHQLQCDGAHCCLGVLCVVAGYDIDDIDGSYRKLEALVKDYGPFVEMNDIKEMSFLEIADYIEANL